jgi:chemotaxis protein histidine kinase CheA
MPMVRSSILPPQAYHLRSGNQRAGSVNDYEKEGILAIFLTEAHSIVRHLREQLVELQYGYDGQGILDGIHRGFHTLHGGASVLKLVELTECAHLAELLMDCLRHRRVSLNLSLVSLISNTTDTISAMLTASVNQQSPQPMSAELKRRLQNVLKNPEQELNIALNTTAKPSNDVELQGLFFDGRLQPRSALKAAENNNFIDPEQPSVNQIDDDEFENLLDTLYGKGQGPSSLAMQGDADLTTMKPVIAQNRASRASKPSLSGAGTNAHADMIKSQNQNAETIFNLVQELSWVRQRLLRFRGQSQFSQMDKALSYLDLVTEDIESWLDNSAH